MGSVSLSEVKRPVRTRMQGAVGGSGERPGPTQLGQFKVYFCVQRYRFLIRKTQ